MKGSVCTAIILVSLLECLVSVEVNVCILVASRSKPSDLARQSSDGTKKELRMGQYLLGWWEVWNLSKSAVDNDKNFQMDRSMQGPTMQHLSVCGCRDRNTLATWYLIWVCIQKAC